MMMIIMSSAAAKKDNPIIDCGQYYPHAGLERMAEEENTNYVSVVVLATDEVVDSIDKCVGALGKECHLLATESRCTIILSQIPANRIIELIKLCHPDESRVEAKNRNLYPRRTVHPCEIGRAHV